MPGTTSGRRPTTRPPIRSRWTGGTLVSEHLTSLRTLFPEAFAVVRSGGRLVFSAFHPEIARVGVEANLERDGVEYRLGAEHYTVDDYLDHIYDAGFRALRWRSYSVDAPLSDQVPWASRYLGRSLLFLVEAERPDLRIA